MAQSPYRRRPQDAEGSVALQEREGHQRGLPTSQTAATARPSLVLKPLTLTPHHSITPTTPTTLTIHDLRFLHDHHQRNHNHRSRTESTDSTSTHAGYPAERNHPQ